MSASTPAAGALAARLALDTSGFNASMAASGQISERELKRIQRQVTFVSDYIKEMGRQQKVVNDTANMSKVVAEVARVGQAAEISAKQLSQANRLLPAQITDIFTSLAGGQNPGLVLIQQGGQIKDMYGGIGDALRNVIALIGPARLAFGGIAATVGLAAYEMSNGSERAREFQKQLAMTGNAAGLTEQSLRNMAEAQAALTRRSSLDARETITAAAATGRFGPGSIQEISAAMAAYQRLTGETAEKAAQHFAKMADGAAKWAQEENKSRHFLTAEIYRQAAAMEDAGRKQEAMALIAKAWTEDTKRTHIPQLGYLGTAWKEWGVAIDWVKDKIRNFGAPSTLTDDFVKAQARLQLAQQAVESAERNARAGLTAARPQDARRELELAQQAFAQAEARMKLEEAGAKARAEIARREEEGVEAERKRREDAKKAAEDAKKAAEKAAREKWELEKRNAVQMFRDEDERAAREEKAAKEREDREVALQKLLRDLKLTGDSVDLDAEREQATGKWLRDAADQAKAAQRQVSGELQLAEDAIINFAKTGKLSFQDLWTFMAEEYLRNLIRMQVAKYALDGAGNFVGWGTAATNFVGMLGGLFGANSHATGLEYVPYDGYPAILHEGEKVMTKAEASYERSGGRGALHIDARTTIGSVGAGVSRAEMAAAMSQQSVATEARMRRLAAQGAFQ